jgi:inositol oxygenase
MIIGEENKSAPEQALDTKIKQNEGIKDPNAKEGKNFRKYLQKTSVANFYKINHTMQTYESVTKLRSEMLPLRKLRMTVFDAIKLMDEIIDDSDPDTKRPQIVHALQTGEACRRARPDDDWYHLLGFIHDMGKVMAHKKMYDMPQWAVTGDTFPVGCKFDEKVVFHEYFKENPDNTHEVYSTKNGVYSEGCGIENLFMSWGHDEYLYQVLKANKCKLPDEALYVIRFHSFYPWHHDDAYQHFMNEHDRRMLKMVQDFQKCDLYSKVDEELKVDQLVPYYEKLIEKYFEDTTLTW